MNKRATDSVQAQLDAIELEDELEVLLKDQQIRAAGGYTYYI